MPRGAIYSGASSAASFAYNNPVQTVTIAAVVVGTLFQPENAPALPEEIGAIAETTTAARLVLSRCGDASVVDPFATGILTSERRPRAMFSSPRRVASGVSEPR